jgi:hypothetical protein
MVEQEGHGVREHFAQHSACQVPQVTRPHPLYGVALCELREDGVYPVAKTAKQGASFGVGIALFGLVGGRQLDTLPSQLLPNWRRPVVAVPNYYTPGTLDQFGQYRKLMDVGRSYRKAGDEPRPTDPNVHPEAVEGLLEESVFAEGGLTPEAMAAVSAGKQARWQGQRVADGESGVVRGKSEKLLPEVVFELPEVGCLPSEGGAMDLPEGGEPLCVVSSEVAIEGLVGVETEELSDDLYGEDLRVGELGGRAALTEAAPSFELVIYQAEDGHNEGAKIHKKKTSFTSVGLVATERREVFSLVQALKKTCTRG